MLDGGNKQHGKIYKEYDTSTTAELEPVLLISKIDTEEGRYVEIIDIPNA